MGGVYLKETTHHQTEATKEREKITYKTSCTGTRTVIEALKYLASESKVTVFAE
jgi:hypothetical protein